MEWIYTKEITCPIKHKIAKLDFGDYVIGSVRKVGVVNNYFGGKNWKKGVAYYVELNLFSERNVKINSTKKYSLKDADNQHSVKFKVSRFLFLKFLSLINNGGKCYDIILYKNSRNVDNVNNHYATVEFRYLDELNEHMRTEKDWMMFKKMCITSKKDEIDVKKRKIAELKSAERKVSKLKKDLGIAGTEVKKLPIEYINMEE